MKCSSFLFKSFDLTLQLHSAWDGILKMLPLPSQTEGVRVNAEWGWEKEKGTRWATGQTNQPFAVPIFRSPFLSKSPVSIPSRTRQYSWRRRRRPPPAAPVHIPYLPPANRLLSSPVCPATYSSPSPRRRSDLRRASAWSPHPPPLEGDPSCVGARGTHARTLAPLPSSGATAPFRVADSRSALGRVITEGASTDPCACTCSQPSPLDEFSKKNVANPELGIGAASYK